MMGKFLRYYSEKHTSLVVFGDVISFDMFLFLVGGFYVSTPLKNISELGLLFPIYGKIKVMFQTTNQIVYVILNKM